MKHNVVLIRTIRRESFVAEARLRADNTVVLLVDDPRHYYKSPTTILRTKPIQCTPQTLNAMFERVARCYCPLQAAHVVAEYCNDNFETDTRFLFSKY